MFDIKHHLDENGATTQTKLSIFALLLPGKSHTISHLSYNNNGDKCDGPTYGTDWLVFRPVIMLIGPRLFNQETTMLCKLANAVNLQ